MTRKIHLTLITAAAAILAGCASQPPAGPAGQYLVYRDGSGNVVRQFDYPSTDFCKRVEAMAGRSARCQAESLATRLPVHASLRYIPPDVVIHGHYNDMARCQTDTRELPQGVRQVEACRTK